MVRQTSVLEMSKPLETSGEFSGYKTKDGHIDLENSRYPTRIRRGDRVSAHDNEIAGVLPTVVWQMKVVLKDGEGNEFVGDARKTRGRTTFIHSNNLLPDFLQSVRVIGRPEPTSAEKAADELLLFLLQGKATLRMSSFIRDVWFPPKLGHKRPTVNETPTLFAFPGLNESQAKAATGMILSSPELLVVHGKLPFV